MKSINSSELINEPGATGLLSDYKDHTDPQYVGPGTWNVIHRQSFKARTNEQQLIFIQDMKEICYGFPCSTCKDHCTNYIKNHPLEEYLNILVDVNGEQIAIGMFVWAWKFHNAVNARIKKPIMSWNTAINLYSESESLVCSKNCLDAGDVPPDGSEHSEKSHPSTKPHSTSNINKITTINQNIKSIPIYPSNPSNLSITNIQPLPQYNQTSSIPKIPEFKIATQGYIRPLSY